MQVECPHRKYDEPIYSVDQTQYTLLYGGAYYGSTKYGENAYGPDYYSLSYGNILQMGDVNGIPYAIMAPQHPMAAKARIFYKDYNSYQRTELPMRQNISISGDISVGNWYMGDTTSGTDTAIPLYKINYSASPVDFYVASLNLKFVIPGNAILILMFDSSKVWLLDYNIPQTDCPYCFGSGYTNDLVFTRLGTLGLVYNNEKLAQTVTRATIFSKGQNPYFPAYGTNLQSMIGSKSMNNAWILRSELYNMLTNIRNLQAYIDKIRPGFFSPYEILENIGDITIKETDGGMSLQFTFILINRALNKVITKPLTLKL